LATVGEVMIDEEMVRTTLDGFIKPLAPFIKGIVARETLPMLPLHPPHASYFQIVTSERPFE